MSGPARTVHCTEALGWLRARPVLAGCSVITSLPDVSEVGLGLEAWKRWFGEAAETVLTRIPDEGVAIFFQTDIKEGGLWIDKGYLVHAAAERAGVPLLWHKIVCRRAAGAITFGRPSYAHLLCYAPKVRLDLARSTADVLPEPGEMTWARAMPIQACLAACRYVQTTTPTRTIVDPFCGKGTVLAVANELGFEAVGVELSRRRAAQARVLETHALEGLPSSLHRG